MKVEVCYASETRQALIVLNVGQDCTAGLAIEKSGVLREFPEIDLSNAKIGIFSKKISLNHILRAGDRVEIYRPLKVDPMEARLRRAKK